MLKQSSTGRRPGLPPSPERAAEIAVAALGQLASDQDALGAFLALTGLAAADIRAAAGSPPFLAAVLDFVCSREDQMMALANGLNESPDYIDLARRVLAGPEGDWSA